MKYPGCPKCSDDKSVHLEQTEACTKFELYPLPGPKAGCVHLGCVNQTVKGKQLRGKDLSWRRNLTINDELKYILDSLFMCC